MKKVISKNYVLAILSSFLLIPGWYEWGTGLTLMVAFIPILVIIQRYINVDRGGRRVYLLSSLCILLWNIGDTWWIKNASFAGLLAALFVSTFFMSWPLWFTYKTWKRWGRTPGLFAFIVFWIAFEFAYTFGEISWPWLTLGNGFAYEVKLIQWYEVTGTMGGSLWVLLANVLIYLSVFSTNNKIEFNRKFAIISAAIIIIPLVVSIVRYNTYEEVPNPRRVVVVQPNIDPYMKFNDIPPIEQTHIQVKLAHALSDSTVDYVVAPETSIMNNIWISRFDEVPDFKVVSSFQELYPQMKYITGIMCYKQYDPDEKRTNTAKPYRNSDKWYDSFNSAIQIDSTDSIQLYHKSKLVVGVEKMPYPGALKILKSLTLRLGGTFRSHATQAERGVLSSPGDSVKVAPVICYESVFGEFVTDYVKKGANVIFVITNDGWWGDTPGHRQHNSLSSVRAIETRRSVARSANTGISSFINQRGDVLQSLGWWKRGALIDNINLNNKQTFYTRYGDYIGRAAFYSSILIALSLLSIALRKKKARIN